ncbi:hypothetical protein BOW52_06155 [Solemya elarraichensis gill symbiont]|uniref:Uncharacterized protein n=1 Tax=Solemya elarraichensis gill symbiont TaxID=1918949 RepID=A0A1T2L576_9GAMM|nr:hypothetical protein BOW52_06155 [Solemya elarraichensis gill symbiont]
MLEYLPILSLQSIKAVNLQYGDVSDQITDFYKASGIQVHEIEDIDNTNDIDALFSLIEACDFIITTSNATPHFAGAMNKETFLLSPKVSGKLWYWKHRDDQGRSLWYPSVRIFDQTNTGDWSEPVEKIKSILENREIA